jgi:hypothetical protein
MWRVCVHMWMLTCALLRGVISVVDASADIVSTPAARRRRRAAQVFMEAMELFMTLVRHYIGSVPGRQLIIRAGLQPAIRAIVSRLGTHASSAIVILSSMSRD